MSVTQSERLPFYVYGTLRPGQGNYSWALAGKTISERTARLRGAKMHGVSGFPYVVLDDPGDAVGEVVGTICTVADHLYDEVLSDLDSLEGYRGPSHRYNHYDRVVKTVTTDAGEKVKVYTYVAANKERVRAEVPVITSGDWLAHLASRDDDVDAWWENYR